MQAQNTYVDGLFTDPNYVALDLPAKMRLLNEGLQQDDNYKALPDDTARERFSSDLLENRGLGQDLERLFDAIPVVESHGNAKAFSPKGARGLYQIMPDTARRLDPHVRPEQLDDPAVSRRLGRLNLALELQRFDGNYRNALLAYNGGPRAVTGNFPESEDYANKVLRIAGMDPTKRLLVNRPKEDEALDQRSTWSDVAHEVYPIAGGMAGGAFAAARSPMPMWPATVPAGIAAGSSIAKAGAYGQDYLLNEPLRDDVVPPMTQVMEAGIVPAAATLGAMSTSSGPGSAVAGATAQETAQLILQTINHRMYGEKFDAMKPGSLAFTEQPGGQALQNISMNTLIDLAMRYGVGPQLAGLLGYKQARKHAEDSLKGARFAETEAVSNLSTEADAAINDAIYSASDGLEQNLLRKQARERAELTPAAISELGRELDDDTAQEQFETFLRKSKEDVNTQNTISPAAGGIPSQKVTDYAEEQKKSILRPRRQERAALGRKYDAFEAPHADKAFDTTELSDKVKNIVSYMADPEVAAATNDDVKLRQLVKQAQKFGPKPSEDEIRKLLAAGDMDGVQRLLQGGRKSDPHIKELIGLSRKASYLTAFGDTRTAQDIARRIKKATYGTLRKQGVPIKDLEKLNSRYAFFRKSFRHVDAALSNALNAGEYPKALFERPQAALQLWSAAKNAKQRGDLRNALADFVLNQDDTKGALKKLDSKVLRMYFGKSAFENVASWINLSEKLKTVEAVLDTSPEARKRLWDLVKQKTDVLTAQHGQELVEKAEKLADKLGYYGRELRDKMNANPGEPAAKIAWDFFTQASPDKVAEAYLRNSPGPSQVAIKALANIPRRGFFEYIVNHAPFAAAIGTSEFLHAGVMGPYVSGILELGIIAAPAAYVRRRVLNSFREPEKAQKFLKAIYNGSYDAWANALTDATIAEVVTKIHEVEGVNYAPEEQE